MSLTIDGKGWSLRRIMRDKKYETFTRPQMQELHKQLVDAQFKASRPIRRDEYEEHATTIALLLNKLDQEAAQ